MNDSSQSPKSSKTSWTVLVSAVAIALLFLGAVYFTGTRADLATLRAELRSRGFSLSVSELTASRKEPPRNLNEFVEADQELERLNFPALPGALRLMQLAPPAVPLPFIKRDKPFWGASDVNLTNRTWEDLAEAAKQAKSTLQKIRTLARQRIPEHGLGPNTPVFRFHDLALWLAADAMSELRQGFRSAALEDVESLTDLALIGAREKDLLAQIGRSMVISAAIKTSWEILQSSEWTEPELVRIEVAWGRILPLQAVEASAEGEIARAEQLGPETRKVVAKSRLEYGVAGILGELDEAEDTHFFLKWSLAYWETARALQTGQKWQVLQPSLEKEKSKALARLNSRYRHLGLRLNLARIYSIFEDCARFEAARQLILTDIAIRKFQLRHNGALPDTLRELAPELLDQASGQDLFGGGDPKYRKNSDGSYLLYSVGIDGVDNGGDASVGKENRTFWDSRDMVWPRCR